MAPTPNPGLKWILSSATENRNRADMSDKPDIAERIGTAINELDIDFSRFTIVVTAMMVRQNVMPAARSKPLRLIMPLQA